MLWPTQQLGARWCQVSRRQVRLGKVQVKPSSQAVIHCSAKKGNVDDATAWFKRMLENGLKDGPG